MVLRRISTTHVGIETKKKAHNLVLVDKALFWASHGSEWREIESKKEKKYKHSMYILWSLKHICYDIRSPAENLHDFVALIVVQIS